MSVEWQRSSASAHGSARAHGFNSEQLKPMGAGELVSAKHIEEMLRAQGLSRRGLARRPERPAASTPPGVPFAVHHHMLTQAGVHHIESAKLDEIARDKLWISCTMILPLREKGAAGSAIRPVAIGALKKVAEKSKSVR